MTLYQNWVMVAPNRVVHVIFRRKIAQKCWNLPVPLKLMRMKVTCKFSHFILLLKKSLFSGKEKSKEPRSWTWKWLDINLTPSSNWFSFVISFIFFNWRSSVYARYDIPAEFRTPIKQHSWVLDERQARLQYTIVEHDSHGTAFYWDWFFFSLIFLSRS